MTASGQVLGSVLESVVVHAAGAVCERRARCAVPPGGTGSVRIGGLPPVLDGASLRARVVSGGGTRVTDARLEPVAPDAPRNHVPAGPLMDVEDAQDRAARLRRRRDRLRAQIDEVAALRAEPPSHRRGEPPRWAPVESILTLAGFVDARLTVLHGRLTAAEDDLARAEHAVDVLEWELAAASGETAAEGTTRPVITAVLSLAPAPATTDPGAPGPAAADSADRTASGDGAEHDGTVELALEYRVPGAAWTPVYQLRLDGAGSGGGTLVMRACVAQRTGEDWTGVRLGLSTADLLGRTVLPELRSLRVGRGQDAPAAHGWREPPPGLAELFTGYDTAKAAAPARSESSAGGTPAVPRVPLPVPAPPVAAAFPAFATDHADLAAAPPPPAPAGFAGYGAPEAGGGYASAPAPAPGAAPKFSSSGAAPAVRPAGRRHMPRAAAPEPRPPQPAGATPSDELLDYAGLTLTGPDAGSGRGTLKPAAATDAVTEEYRRRAESVGRLARPAHAVDVRRAAGSFDHRFDTAAPADVAADGVWHTVPVCEIAVTMRPAYVCVPAVDPAVYGTVELTNTSAHPLLAGPADVVVDGDFVLTAALPTLAPGERQAVGTGVVESVRVARRTAMRESTAGLRGGTTVLDHSVEIDVANRLPHPVTVEVRERVPVSEDKDVRVEEHTARPAWTDPGEPLPGQENAHVRGARVWRAAVDPGATVTLTGGYVVRLPAGKALVGGNRRN